MPIRRLRAPLAAAALLLLAAVPAAGQTPRVRRVLPGDSVLRVDRVRTGVDTFGVFLVSGGRRVPAGTFVMRTSRRNGDRGPLLHRVETMALGARPVVVDSSALSAATLALSWVGGSDGAGRSWARWDGARIRGMRSAGSAVTEVDLPLPHPVFHDNLTDVVLAALPLREGWRATWPVFDRTAGALRWVDAAVDGAETVVLRNGTSAKAWRVRVTADGDVATYWIGRNDGRFLRYAAAPREGIVFSISR